MSFKVTRLTVGKGLTNGDEKSQTWTRQYYEIEATIEAENQIELAKNSIEALLALWLKGENLNPKPQAANRENPLPAGTDLASLPWKSYQTKQDAKPDEAAWIFRNTEGAEVLVATLKTKDKAQIDGMEYSFSGNEHQFISRNPAKR